MVSIVFVVTIQKRGQCRLSESNDCGQFYHPIFEKADIPVMRKIQVNPFHIWEENRSSENHLIHLLASQPAEEKAFIKSTLNLLILENCKPRFIEYPLEYRKLEPSEMEDFKAIDKLKHLAQPGLSWFSFVFKFDPANVHPNLNAEHLHPGFNVAIFLEYPIEPVVPAAELPVKRAAKDDPERLEPHYCIDHCIGKCKKGPSCKFWHTDQDPIKTQKAMDSFHYKGPPPYVVYLRGMPPFANDEYIQNLGKRFGHIAEYRLHGASGELKYGSLSYDTEKEALALVSNECISHGIYRIVPTWRVKFTKILMIEMRCEKLANLSVEQMLLALAKFGIDAKRIFRINTIARKLSLRDDAKPEYDKLIGKSILVGDQTVKFVGL